MEPSSNSRAIVTAGTVSDMVHLAIVNPETCEKLDEDQVGEIWLSSPSCAMGYWNNTEKTHTTFEAQIKGDESGRFYLRTGDLGFIQKGELFVSGTMQVIR